MIGVIYSLIGIFVGSFVTYLFTLKIIRNQELIKAKTNFRIALMPVVIKLQGEVKSLLFLIDSIPDQERYFIELMAQLPKGEGIALNRAWQKYAYPNQKDFESDPRMRYRVQKLEEIGRILPELKENVSLLMSFAEM